MPKIGITIIMFEFYYPPCRVILLFLAYGSPNIYRQRIQGHIIGILVGDNIRDDRDIYDNILLELLYFLLQCQYADDTKKLLAYSYVITYNIRSILHGMYFSLDQKSGAGQAIRCIFISFVLGFSY